MLFTLYIYLKNAIFYIVAPPFCGYCKIFLNTREIFCISCNEKILPIVSKNISLTKNKSLKVYAVSDYQDPLKKLILAKGWSDIIACYQLGQLLCDIPYIDYSDFDFIVPIPLHWSRYAWRGYNQADEIAKIIGKNKNIPVASLLKRVKRTVFQSELAFDKRVENVKKAFVLDNVKKETFKNKHILLVDDLMTTGSTLKMAAKELMKLKPKKISALVVCRVK